MVEGLNALGYQTGGGVEGFAFTLLKGGSAFCGQNAFRGRGGVKKGPKTAVILNVWPLATKLLLGLLV